MYTIQQLSTRQCTEIAYRTRRPTDMNYNIIIEKILYNNIIIPTTPSRKTFAYHIRITYLKCHLKGKNYSELKS